MPSSFFSGFFNKPQTPQSTSRPQQSRPQQVKPPPQCPPPCPPTPPPCPPTPPPCPPMPDNRLQSVSWALERVISWMIKEIGRPSRVLELESCLIMFELLKEVVPEDLTKQHKDAWNPKYLTPFLGSILRSNENYLDDPIRCIYVLGEVLEFKAYVDLTLSEYVTTDDKNKAEVVDALNVLTNLTASHSQDNLMAYTKSILTISSAFFSMPDLQNALQLVYSHLCNYRYYIYRCIPGIDQKKWHASAYQGCFATTEALKKAIKALDSSVGGRGPVKKARKTTAKPKAIKPAVRPKSKTTAKPKAKKRPMVKSFV